jgi:endoglucanase
MKKNLIGFLSLLFLVQGSFAQQANFFSTKGKEIISPDGKPFIMRGTNLGNWLVPEGYMFRLGDVNSARLINQTFSELIGKAEATLFWQKFLDNYITENDINYLSKIGVNSIRVPFNYRLFTYEDYMGANDPQRGFKYFDKLISWCRKAKIYIVLDMHCAPGGQTGDNIDDGYGYPFLFKSSADQHQAAEIWKKIATRYRNERMIIGYDLLNEPIATYFNAADFNPYLEKVYKIITAAIRSVDKNHLIILGGAQWDSNFKPFGRPFDNKLVYTFHKYWTPATQQVIQPYIDFGNKYNVPIYCGETGENRDSWVDSFRVVLESNKIGWHFWPYKKPNNTKGFVQFTTPLEYDSIVA